MKGQQKLSAQNETIKSAKLNKALNGQHLPNIMITHNKEITTQKSAAFLSFARILTKPIIQYQ